MSIYRFWGELKILRTKIALKLKKFLYSLHHILGVLFSKSNFHIFFLPFTNCIFQWTICQPQHDTCLKGDMRHTSTTLYFYRTSKKSLHKPRANFRNILFQINYSLNYYIIIYNFYVYSFYIELT